MQSDSGADPHPSFAALEGSAARRAQIKLAILSAWHAHHAQSGLSVKASQAEFAARFNSGEIIVEGVQVPGLRLSARSLRRWSAALNKLGPGVLAGRYGEKKRAGLIDSNPELRDHVLGIIANSPHARASHLYRAIKSHFEGKPLPSSRAVERWFARWKRDNPQQFQLLTNPDAWRNRSQAAFGSASEAVTRLNQVWELDSTPADVMLQGGRHAVVGLIDVFTRRAMVLVSKTSRSVAVAALLRKAILAWGVPESIKTDNGKDYVSAHIVAAAMALDIQHSKCRPFTPEQKPHIERFFGTLTRGLFERLPGFIGHSVEERKGIRGRETSAQQEGDPIQLGMTPDALQLECDNWCEREYGRAPHEGLGGRTPFDVAQEHIAEKRQCPVCS